MPSSVYHATLSIIRSLLEEEGYRCRTTNKTEFFRAFDDDQEGKILIRCKNDIFSYQWSYRANGVVVDHGISEAVRVALQKIDISQALDVQLELITEKEAVKVEIYN
ncbi:hypothetical protein HGG76_27450 [Ochrobactrum tritici]|uniref:Uncharacterized protein n=1 Tax=Brucella tritici TaxID=94626 RepID=A0A7X6JD41_9HYPH|nr:hypothetical protein [Brucella tritici]